MKGLGEFARRRRKGRRRSSLLVLGRESADAVVAREHGLPVAAVRSVRSFYDFLEEVRPFRRAETACWSARGAPIPELSPGAWVAATKRLSRSDEPSGTIPRVALVDSLSCYEGSWQGVPAIRGPEYDLPTRRRL